MEKNFIVNDQNIQLNYKCSDFFKSIYWLCSSICKIFILLYIFGEWIIKNNKKKNLQPWSGDLSDWTAGKAQNACIWCNCIKIAVTYFVNFYLVKSLK